MNAFQTIMEISKQACPNDCVFCDNVEQLYYKAEITEPNKAKVASLVWKHLNGIKTFDEVIIEAVRIHNILIANA